MFTEQVDAALRSGQVGLDTLPACLTAVEALKRDLEEVKPANATYHFDTQSGEGAAASQFKTVLTSLYETGYSLDGVRQELKAQMASGSPPGWMTHMLHRVGTLLGAIAAAAVVVAAAQLALPFAITVGAAGATLAVIAGMVAKTAAAARLSSYAVHWEQDAPRRACLAQLDDLRAMVIRAEVDLVLANIRDQLTPEAAEYHAQLLAPPVVDTSGNAVDPARLNFRPILKFVGDGDGSDDRGALAAFGSGYILFTDVGQAMLAQRLQAEADYVLQDHSNFSDFQKNEGLWDLADDLWGEMAFREGIDPLIFLGDLIHDRLASNMRWGGFIRGWLKRFGVTFLAGNHDDYRVRVDERGQKRPVPDFAGFAADWATREQWEAHERAVFDDIYYDEKSGVIANHQGFRIGPDGTVQTAKGFFRFTGNPKDLFEDVRNSRRVAMPEDAQALRPSEKLQLLMSITYGDAANLGLTMNPKILLTHAPAGACTADRWSDAKEVEIATWLETYNKPGYLTPEFWEGRLAMYHSGRDQLDFHTSFRPSFEDNKSVVEAFAAKGHRLIVFKGHDDERKIGGGVFSMNARAGGAGGNHDIRPTMLALYVPEAADPAAPPVGTAKANPWLTLASIAPAKLSKPAPVTNGNGAIDASGNPNPVSA
ncbi:hypothetical protein MB84_28875 (plasmid) [Pandoraea oxalativorans]|uniref:Calcineurin-like phosphoesterase domain-containing protein n=1 Tax=Pandoraea oxalativorans TaxID=573737 RepID=A0A0G3IC85_9BURK|nr:hypothetical protein MB84_28875 [Pandoraea oxalativorans]